jgi:DNA-binding PadR family transcriptional regulator
MIDISNAESALLGLLTESEKHPYQLERDVRERDMKSWTELSLSHIYKSLKRLDQAGLVAHRTEISPENRTRLVYRITSSGYEALRDKFTHLLSQPDTLRFQTDIAFYNLGLLSRDERLCLLAFYRTAVEKRIAEYRELEAYMLHNGCPTHHRSISRRPRYMLEAEIAWLDDLIAEVRKEEPNAVR